MPKPKPSKSDMSIRDDPRVRDPVVFNRLKEMVEKEAIDRAWGCELWKMERLGKLAGNEAESRVLRRAGDEYQRIVLAGRRALDWDVERFPPEVHERMIDTITRAKRKWEEARDLLRFGKDGIWIQLAVDDLCLDEIWPHTEKQKQRVRTGLTRLAHYFGYKSKSAA